MAWRSIHDCIVPEAKHDIFFQAKDERKRRAQERRQGHGERKGKIAMPGHRMVEGCLPFDGRDLEEKRSSHFEKKEKKRGLREAYREESKTKRQSKCMPQIHPNQNDDDEHFCCVKDMHIYFIQWKVRKSVSETSDASVVSCTLYSILPCLLFFSITNPTLLMLWQIMPG